MAKRPLPGPDGACHLRSWRKTRGWKLEELAAAMDPPTKASTLSRLERGGMNWRQDLIEAAAKVLAVSPFELLFVDPDDPAAFLRTWIAGSPWGATAMQELLSYAARELSEGNDLLPTARPALHGGGQAGYTTPRIAGPRRRD